jgi:hypothetical protein
MKISTDCSGGTGWRDVSEVRTVVTPRRNGRDPTLMKGKIGDYRGPRGEEKYGCYALERCHEACHCQRT